MRFLTFLSLAAVFLAACGGTSTSVVGDAGLDARSEGGNPSACPATQPSAGSPCSPEGLECTFSPNPACSGYWDCTGGVWRQSFPGVACMLDSGPTGGNCYGTTNVIHRAQAAACSSNTGVDAGCMVTPHDQCLTDTDCGSGNVCVCQSPIPAGQPCPGGTPLSAGNVCAPSTCRVDSDCPACGVCEAEFTCGQIIGYHCQTPTDECAPTGPTVGYSGNGCHWSSGQWMPTGTPACPG